MILSVNFILDIIECGKSEYGFHSESTPHMIFIRIKCIIKEVFILVNH